MVNAGFFTLIILIVNKKNTPVKNLCCVKAIILVGPGSIKTVRGTNTPNGSYKLMDVAQVHPQTASMLCTFFELLTPPRPPIVIIVGF
jgi:hypothetical protein